MLSVRSVSPRGLAVAPPTLHEAVRHFILGMPHLAHGGLSECWLLKECGDIHWQLLARHHDLPLPDFRDRDGNRLYAAFVGLRLLDARLHKVSEHNPLQIASSLSRTTRTRFVSSHAITSGRILVGRLEMASVFVRRLAPRDNYSVARSIPDCPDVENRHGKASDRMAADFPSRAVRSNDASWEIMGFRASDRAPSLRTTLAPCPYHDFNGADFLYFASFQALADRAEWAWEGHRGLLTTRRREILYHGNVNVGDAVIAQRCALREHGAALAHWTELITARTGAKIADVFTLKCSIEEIQANV